jgi:hypothetical protein
MPTAKTMGEAAMQLRPSRIRIRRLARQSQGCSFPRVGLRQARRKLLDFPELLEGLLALFPLQEFHALLVGVCRKLRGRTRRLCST